MSLFATRSGIIGAALVAVVGGAAIAAGLLAPAEGLRLTATPFAAPSWEHPFGTDDLGRDLFGAILHGARVSLGLAGLVVAAASLLGLGLGSAAGIGPRWRDEALMRIAEVFQIAPRFFLALVVVALFGSGVAMLALVLVLTSWPISARIVRAELLGLRQREFAVAARAAGVSELRILARHLWPHVLPALVITAALQGAAVILLEAGLSFLGLGDRNLPSWGYLIYSAQPFLRTAWWMALFPGLAVTLTIVGLNLLADGLEAAADPRRARRQGRSGSGGCRRDLAEQATDAQSVPGPELVEGSPRHRPRPDPGSDQRCFGDRARGGELVSPQGDRHEFAVQAIPARAQQQTGAAVHGAPEAPGRRETRRPAP